MNKQGRVRLLSRTPCARGTGSLLQPASLNNWAAALLSRLRWKLVRPYRVAPGTEIVFYGQPAPNRIVVVVDEDKSPLPYNPCELPDYPLEELDA